MISYFKKIKKIKELLNKKFYADEPFYAQSNFLGKTLILTISSSIFSVFLYANIAKIDEVVIAKGELQNPGAERIIKSPLMEDIELINISEGEYVRENQLLLKFKSDKLLAREKAVKKNLKSLAKSLQYRKEIIDKMSKIYEEGGISSIEILNQKNLLLEIEMEIEKTKLDLAEIKASKRTYSLFSPINGSVFELVPSSPGYLASKGEILLKIIPKGFLEAKVFVENKDIGFIKNNMKVEIRVDAYPYTSYGFINGSVKLIGKEAIPEKNTSKLTTYPIYLNIEKQYLNKSNKKFKLKSGQSITANFIVKQKPLISLISDIFYDAKESLKDIKSGE